MKYLVLLIVGIILGIGGELLIPENLYTTVGSGCIKYKVDGRTYMPELLIYDKTMADYPIQFGGHPMTFMPSYRYAYALLTGEFSYLSQSECNDLIGKYIDSKHGMKPRRGPQKRPHHGPKPLPSIGPKLGAQ
jgi:hypothetical protein